MNIDGLSHIPTGRHCLLFASRQASRQSRRCWIGASVHTTAKAYKVGASSKKGSVDYSPWREMRGKQINQQASGNNRLAKKESVCTAACILLVSLMRLKVEHSTDRACLVLDLDISLSDASLDLHSPVAIACLLGSGWLGSTLCSQQKLGGAIVPPTCLHIQQREQMTKKPACEFPSSRKNTCNSHHVMQSAS